MFPIDKSKGINRVVEGIEFYNGFNSPSIIAEVNGKECYIGCLEMIVTPDHKKDDMIKYHIMKCYRSK